MSVPAGLDTFVTIEDETHILFPNYAPIPADFFDPGSAAFVGTIHLVGYPLRKIIDPRTKKEYKSKGVDTVVLRKKEVAINKIGGSGTTEIELVQLSLRSARPIKVRVGRETQLWDVHVSLSRSTPSVGTMTITQTTEHGGVFASELRVVPHLRFERREDGEERNLDMGAMKIPDEKQKLVAEAMTLRSSEVGWQDSAPAGAHLVPELAGNFALATTNNEAALLASHGVGHHTVLQ